MNSPEWNVNWRAAFELAQQAGRPVLIDFHLPECVGCRMMEAETFPDREVRATIEGHMTPLRVHADALPHSEDYGVRWTPWLVVAAADGRQLQAAAGFQPAAELTPWLLLGLAKFEMLERRWLGALNHLERVISLHPKSVAAAEAVFLRGVAGYRQSMQALHLKSAYQKLTEEYPTSVWAGRARPYKNF